MKVCYYTIILLFALLSCKKQISHGYTTISAGEPLVIYVSEECDSLIHWAISDVAQSIEYATGSKWIIKEIKELSEVNTSDNNIIIGLFNDPIIQEAKVVDVQLWQDAWEQFLLQHSDNKLFIVGSDIRGTVYGIFEVAERMGISPWKWWADVVPLPQKIMSLELPAEGIIESPSVKYRGIFLNDEDWGLQPWAARTFEPETGDIGPKTYEKIFQLLLRLKANTIWPAMHHCTKPFFAIEGNAEMAKKYHIAIGSSHAEPMLRNNVREWNMSKDGRFNYFTNRRNVQEYWQDRVSETKDAGMECLYTMGMRGIHDSKMEGASNRAEMVQILDTILKDQRDILSSTLKASIENIPQVLVPYKEVLDLYNAGLNVPEDITLMWCDDNYGYIRRLSDEEEQKRKGRAGVYYHLSYWGRPHDYLWLSTTQPGLIWYEMSKAYQNGADEMWIANVGDMKPNEYNMEFFLDLAWDINGVNSMNIKEHLRNFYSREFGVNNGALIANLMDEYYRLAFLRKPEYMGWSQTEPTTITRESDFNQFSNGNEVQRRIDYYKDLVDQMNKVKVGVDSRLQDSFFQLVEYPVCGAAAMNFKFMFAQMAYNAQTYKDKCTFNEGVKQAYADIDSLTMRYNTSISNGKWKYMMDSKPRSLPVFQLPDYHMARVDSLEKRALPEEAVIFIQAKDFKQAKGFENFQWEVIHGLGYSNASVTLYPFVQKYFAEDRPCVSYRFHTKERGKYEVEIRCLPTHSIHFDHELGVSLDNRAYQNFKLNTKGRSLEWKNNVLRNFKSVKYMVQIDQPGEHELSLSVNQTGIVIDQIAIGLVGHHRFYEIPK
ncbi:glycosyl hydrolase 115 family protein [Saccharicrinis fermentans]|uniref:Gylcosyl hydrolase 115 C-terminal domain-containing protein n=1 Tax=Saccharicrinis fermentans DSM 9555 = JCM 21142 TaxID=869213 RepID=W7XVH9_9BACT|nr:glycosyl hydrolase 115 family protein [Saccharicrinis fermentans]GAF02105.1 hypothetical protein JCM21142_2732 [Saccharicrinis fermentans DSM 9555 = JCM 21142]